MRVNKEVTMISFINDITPAFIDLLCVVMTALSGLLITYIKQKKQKIECDINDSLGQKYLDMLENTVISCIKTTNQTFVDELKKGKSFTEDAQQEALEKTYDAVMSILTEECVAYLTTIADDINALIYNKIEAGVSDIKKGYYL